MEMNGVAQNHGLSLLNLEIKDSKDEEKVRGDENMEVSAKGLQSLTVGFGVETTYDKFLSFLRSLEESLPFYDVESLSFAVPEPNKENPGDVYSFSIVVRTYYFK
jgi:hypothetical protein